MTRLSKLQKQILKDRGLQRSTDQQKYGTTTRRHRKLVQSAVLPPDFHKTAGMLLAEHKLVQPIEELVLGHTESRLAQILGVNKSTISRWRAKVMAAYDRDHLPTCSTCEMASMQCVVSGRCIRLALWPQLQELKHKEVLGET